MPDALFVAGLCLDPFGQGRYNYYINIEYTHMKMMTCAQMGGQCDTEITGATVDEMMANGMKHLEEAHPQMAADVKAMPPEDPGMVAWAEKFKQDFEAAPEL